MVITLQSGLTPLNKDTLLLQVVVWSLGKALTFFSKLNLFEWDILFLFQGDGGGGGGGAQLNHLQ